MFEILNTIMNTQNGAVDIGITKYANTTKSILLDITLYKFAYVQYINSVEIHGQQIFVLFTDFLYLQDNICRNS